MAERNWKSIAAEIAVRIESGELAPGSRLPSGDALARDLGVNRNVVHRALEELQRQQLVVRRQGSGTVVAERLSRKTRRIALLVDGYSAVHNFPSGDLLEGIQDRIGEDATLVIADSKHMGTIRMMASGRNRLSYCAASTRNTNSTQMGNTNIAVLPARIC